MILLIDGGSHVQQLQSLAGVLKIAGEKAGHRASQRLRICLGRGTGSHGRSEHGKNVVFNIGLLQALFKFFCGFSGSHRFCGDSFFFPYVVYPHKGRRVANVLNSFFILLDEQLKNSDVSLDLGRMAICHQVGNVGCTGLPIAVDSSIALLESHERPWDIEMYHLVAEVVQVDTFRGNVCGDEQAQRGLVLTEFFYHFLLFGVGIISAQGCDLLVGKLQNLRQMFV